MLSEFFEMDCKRPASLLCRAYSRVLGQGMEQDLDFPHFEPRSGGRGGEVLGLEGFASTSIHQPCSQKFSNGKSLYKLTLNKDVNLRVCRHEILNSRCSGRNLTPLPCTLKGLRRSAKCL